MADEAQQPQTANLPKMRTFGRDVQRAQRAQGITPTEPAPDKKKKDAAPMHQPESVVDGFTRKAPEKTSILSDAGHAFDVGRAAQSPHGGGGTIVTDKRKKRRSFFGTIAAAFQERMGDAKSSISHMEVFQEKVAPRVTAPIARQDVIQKAAQSGVRAPEDDHRKVVEKIKSQQEDAPTVSDKPFVIKEAPKEEAPSWTHVVAEAPKEPTPKPAVQPPKPEAVAPPKEPEPIPKQPEPARAPVEIQKPTPEPIVAKPQPEAVPQQEIVAPVPAPAAPAPMPEVPEKEPAETAPTFEPIPTPAPAPLPRVAELPKITEEAPKQKAPKAPREPGRFRALVMRAAIVLVIVTAIGGGVGAGYYLIRSFGVTTNTPISVAPTVVQTDIQIPLPLSNARTAFLGSLADIVAQSGNGVTHIYPVHEDTGAPATATEILTILDPRAPGTFLRSVGEYLTLGAVTTPNRQPFIVLRTSNFDTGFAGMIAWEPYISSDLAPLFGAPIDRTFDPDARTEGNTREAYFVDGVVQNAPVRILYNQSGEEGIVYGFIDRNTLIITTSTQAFATVRARIQ